MQKKLILSLLSALLLSLPWLGAGGWSLFVAFVPLLILQSENPRRFGLWAALTFTIWILASAWWVSVATMIAAVAVPVVGLFFCWIPFMMYHYVWRRQPGHLAWVVMVTAWICFEALYAYQDISFPWLSLGNGFATMPWAVQWYEYTGAFGGTLWVLVSNILVFNLWQQRRSVKRIVAATVWIAIPLIFSIVRYTTYSEVTEPLTVSVIQPNIDPYGEKFGHEALTQQQQSDIILSLAAKAPADVDFIITPETSFDDRIWAFQPMSSPTITSIRSFMASRYPHSTFIAGAISYDLTPSGDGTESFNSALWIDSSGVTGLYHKSKLVCGVELIPYPEIFSMLQIDLGGVASSMGRQADRAVYKEVGVAICYESIYGAYFTEYIDRGARAMFVITNDGWWGNTQGHRQHLNYARLRAIESRRSIARSANTGISAVINQRGDVVERLDWDERGVINSSLNLNSERTVYTNYKDIVVRLSAYVLALSLLFFVGQRFRKKQ